MLPPICRVSSEFNLPFERYFRKWGLPLWAREDPDVWVPTHAVLCVSRDIRGNLGTEEFGAWIDGACDLSALGNIKDHLDGAYTLYEAIGRYKRFYTQFRSYAHLSVRHQGKDIWLQRIVDVSNVGNSEILEAYALSEMTKVVQMAAGKKWRPKQASLQSNNDSILKTLSDFSEADIILGAPSCGLAISKKLLSDPIAQTRQRGLSQAAILDDPPLSPPQDFSECLLAIISTRFEEGYPNLRNIAESIGLTPRTIQRYLAAEGLTYRDVIDLYRFRKAKEMIVADRSRIVDVAAALEYENAGNFTRAFRRWAGVSPREYRLLHMHS